MSKPATFEGYTFLMLLASTGHRPADIFTFSIASIDLNNGWIIISDKITSASTRVRLIPLPPIVIKQLQNYMVHLRNLSKRIQSEYSELADKISLLTDEPYHSLILAYIRSSQSHVVECFFIIKFDFRRSLLIDSEMTCCP